jgi:hypothetical protein
VLHQRAVLRGAHVADDEAVVAGLVHHAALVAREDLPVVVVGQRADARAARRADVHEVGVLAAEDLREEDGRVALEDLLALAVQLEDVLDGGAVEVAVLGAVVLDLRARLLRRSRTDRRGGGRSRGTPGSRYVSTISIGFLSASRVVVSSASTW